MLTSISQSRRMERMRASSPAWRSNTSGSRRNVNFFSFSSITRHTSPPSAQRKLGSGCRWENRSGVLNRDWELNGCWHDDDDDGQTGGVASDRSPGDKELCEALMSFVTSVRWVLCVPQTNTTHSVTRRALGDSANLNQHYVNFFHCVHQVAALYSEEVCPIWQQ